MKKLSKIILTISIFNYLEASGIPTFDAGSIAQAVKQYTQMVKQYEQMIKDTLNFEKQMKEFGVDMTSIQDILGSANSIINDTKNFYNNIKNIPNNFYNEVEDITKACRFLEKESSFFAMKINNVSSDKYSDKINTCISAITDTTEIDKTIDILNKKATTISDPDEFNKIKTEIDNLENAKNLVSEKAKQEKINNLISFYDTYQRNEKNNPYTKAKMDNDLKELSNQLLKSNNTKQSQALTNSILLKLLEMTQRQYELNMHFTSAFANIENQNTSKNTQNNTYNYTQTYQKPKKIAEYNPFYQNIKKQEQDEYGLPKFKF